jgi:hypothetical protein
MLQLRNQIKQAKEKNDPKKHNDLVGQYKELEKQSIEFGLKQRNELFMSTIKKKEQEFPNSVIIAIGGLGHFIHDPAMIKYLETQGQYIILKPSHELPLEERERKAEDYYGSSQVQSS